MGLPCWCMLHWILRYAPKYVKVCACVQFYASAWTGSSWIYLLCFFFVSIVAALLLLLQLLPLRWTLCSLYFNVTVTFSRLFVHDPLSFAKFNDVVSQTKNEKIMLLTFFHILFASLSLCASNHFSAVFLLFSTRLKLPVFLYFSFPLFNFILFI